MTRKVELWIFSFVSLVKKHHKTTFPVVIFSVENNYLFFVERFHEFFFNVIFFYFLDVDDWNGSELDRTLRKVYFSARDGKVDILCQILACHESKQDQEYLLNTPYQDGIGQKCPAFAIAARNGHTNVVDSLISKVNIMAESFTSLMAYLCEDMNRVFKVPFKE